MDGHSRQFAGNARKKARMGSGRFSHQWRRVLGRVFSVAYLPIPSLSSCWRRRRRRRPSTLRRSASCGWRPSGWTGPPACAAGTAAAGAGSPWSRGSCALYPPGSGKGMKKASFEDLPFPCQTPKVRIRSHSERGSTGRERIMPRLRSRMSSVRDSVESQSGHVQAFNPISVMTCS